MHLLLQDRKVASDPIWVERWGGRFRVRQQLWFEMLLVLRGSRGWAGAVSMNGACPPAWLTK